ncbi:MAG: hypothetical protein Q8L23_15965 [Caulobacter sp.]|nr:hypothetical protein [Caulobacter sp.]
MPDPSLAESGRPAPRRRKAEPPPSHADILAGVERVTARQDEAERLQDMHIVTAQRLEVAVANGFAAAQTEMGAIRKSIGDEGEDAYGKPVGTGVVGRLMRLEHRLSRYDGWVKSAGAAGIPLAIAGGVVWWLIQNRLEFLR